MYFVLESKETTLNSNTEFGTTIVDHTFNEIEEARILLETVTRNFVRDEFGKILANSSEIISISKIGEVVEPLVDGVQIYSIKENPDSFYVYHRQSKFVPGLIYGGSTQTSFKLVRIFQLKEYQKLGSNDRNLNQYSERSISKGITSDTGNEMVPIGNAKVKVPKPMTVSPFADVLDSLKKSDKFLKRKERLSNTSVIISVSTIPSVSNVSSVFVTESEQSKQSKQSEQSDELHGFEESNNSEALKDKLYTDMCDALKSLDLQIRICTPVEEEETTDDKRESDWDL